MNPISAFAAAVVLLGYSSASQAAAPSCQVTFKGGSSTPMFSASVFVIYQTAPGAFDGIANNANCQALNGVTVQPANYNETRTLSLTIVGTPSPFSGPKDFAKCTWTPTSRFPVAGDFDLSGQSGFDTSLPFPNPVNANISISKIECTGDVTTTTTTTTTTSSTTTTLPQLCGDFDGNGLLQTSDALNVLKASVGGKPCAFCICDLDGNGVKSATDALIALRSAVGIVLVLNCPLCD